MLRKGLVTAFLFIIVIGIISYTSDAFAETEQFGVAPSTIVTKDFYLNEGDVMTWTITLGGIVDSANPAIDLKIYLPPDYTTKIFSEVCEPTTCGSGSVTADVDGWYRFDFHGPFTRSSPMNVIMEYSIDKKISKTSNGGCLIATATYGSELAPQVQQLRELRDNTLLSTNSGSAFMESFNEIYYSFSPTIAEWERQSPVFKETVKLAITPLVTSLSLLNYVEMDSEQQVLGYGIGIILLNIGMYFVAPAIIINRLFKSKNVFY